MTLAYLDCPTGVAGDMLLAALFDLALPRDVVEAPLAALGLEDAYALRIEAGRSGGLRGTRVGVQVLETQPPHRRWLELRQRIEASALERRLRERVLAVFGLLADAEAAVHGYAPEQVHFHEVGAVDALVDVVGVCAGMLHFGIEHLVCAPPPGGHGTVRTAHGVLPLPAPAVLELARRHAVPLAGAEGMPAGELTTPTGMALITGWAERFGPAPPLVPARVGIGLGHRTLDRPNLLRLLLAAPAGSTTEPFLETVLQQQAQLDDATGEDVAFLAEELRASGALDVFTAAVQMKKGRGGVLVTVLAAPENAAALRAVWWRHSTTLGVREQWQQRWCLSRQRQSVSTPWGPVRLKLALLPGGGQRLKPEHEDLARLARLHQLSLQEVRTAVQEALQLAGDNARHPPPAG